MAVALVGMIKNFGFLDINDFLIACREIFCEKVLEFHQTVKVYVKLEALFLLTKVDRVIEDNKSFISPTFPIYQLSDIAKLYDTKILEILTKNIEEFQETDSGWTLKEINFLTIHVHKYNPLRAGTYIELPNFIARKQACINIKNNDNFCFKWSVICALMNQEMEEMQQVAKIKNAQRVQKYINKEEYFKLDFNGISFPVSPMDIKLFEKKNNISVNLYMISESEKIRGKKICVAQASSIKKQKRHVNLLLLQESNDSEQVSSIETYSDIEKIITKKRKVTVLQHQYNYHYDCIRNLSALISSQASKKNHKKYFCDICFHYMSSKNALIEHEKKCLSVNDCEIILPDPTDEEQWVLKFKNYHHKLRVPFVIYSDFESVLEPMQDERKQQHQPALDFT